MTETMTRVGYKPYEPQLTISPQAEDIWTVEGPEVQYRLAGAVIPCPTRMTVVRLNSGALWLHSPVAHSAKLQQAIDVLGPISAIIAPNSYHYLQVTLGHPRMLMPPFLPRPMWHTRLLPTRPCWVANSSRIGVQISIISALNWASFQKRCFFIAPPKVSSSLI